MQILFVVHGMGNDAGGPLGAADRKAWSKDVESTLRTALQKYPGVQAADFMVVPILYDDVFQTHALTWQALAESLVDTPLAPLTAWMKDAGEEGFAWGSLGDVVQYRALAAVRSHVRTSVAEQIAAVIDKQGVGHSYSILAHSLGTAVAHDAVRALATQAVKGNTVLWPPNFRFANFFALANVSRLVWATDGNFYAETPVRPLSSGLDNDQCAVKYYASFRHVADPVPSLVRFLPTNWDAGHYESFEVRHFRDLNVHGFLHYLAAPRVSDHVLSRLFPAQVTPALRAARHAGYPDYDDPHAAEKELAVAQAAGLLDALSGQAKGKLELDIGALLEAVWSCRDELSKALGAQT